MSREVEDVKGLPRIGSAVCGMYSMILTSGEYEPETKESNIFIS